MGVTVNFSLADAGNLQEFDSLILGTHNATQEITLRHLTSASPAESKKFHALYTDYVAAERARTDYLLRHGTSTEDHDKKLRKAFDKYDKARDKHSADPALDFLNDPIRRKEFNVQPYEIKGKIMPPNPYPGMSAAMDGLWPGYDKPEYFDEYPFLERYRDTAPEGKVLETFLRDHNMFFNFPETISRYGVMFVPPPYLSDDLNVEVRQHLSQCDELYHTCPIVSPTTTVDEARLVLSYLEDDMVVAVMDKGECVGVVSWENLEGQKGALSIKKLFTKGFNEAPKEKLTPEQVFAYMEGKNPQWTYMLQMNGDKPRIVTQTTAAISHFLPPHTFKEGLGSAIYFGISDIEEGNTLINRLKSEADGIPAAIVETAHADTQFYRTILDHYRNVLHDVFLMAGTTVDPKAVLEFLWKYGADAVKLGIAEGRACRTSRTGIAPPNAHVGLECGAALFENGYGALDGWGESDEFIKGLAMSGIQMRQAGGAFVGRRESANPWMKNGHGRGKFYRGMAGLDVQQAVLAQDPNVAIGKRMENAAHLHSEGAEVFVPQRSPSTIGRMLLAHMFLLKSAMSYSGVRAELDPDQRPTKVKKAMQERVLHQFHRMARFYAVNA